MSDSITLHDGRVLRVHAESTCREDPTCAIHRPSDHPMREWPMDWRGGILKRKCPHDHWHPDPDALSYAIQMYQHWLAFHVCDYCCKANKFIEQQEIPEGVVRRDVILINGVTCNFCHEYIESDHRHDFVSCPCGETFVDGGHDYLRRGGSGWTEKSWVITIPD